MPETGVDRSERYWQAQTRAVIALRQIGIPVDMNDRIPPMKVMVKVKKKLKEEGALPPQLKLYQEVANALHSLVKLRIAGFEPKSKDNKYVKEKIG